MALIKCKSCGKEISDKSTKCVHCGCDTDYSITHFCPECGKKYDNIKCMNCGYTKSNDSKERATNQGKVIRFNFIPLLKSLGITGLFTILLSLQSGGLDIIGCFVMAVVIYLTDWMISMPAHMKILIREHYINKSRRITGSSCHKDYFLWYNILN